MPTHTRRSADRQLDAHIAMGRAADQLFYRLLVLSAVVGALLVTAGVSAGLYRP